MSISYRHAEKDDLLAIAQVFLAAFPESVRHYAGDNVKPTVIADIFAICLDSEPDAFYLASADGKVAGYIFAPTKFSKLQYVAITHGHLLRILWRWVTGKYGINISTISIAVRNWLSLLNETRMSEDKIDARILSIAVDPVFQGQKIGTNLMHLALDHLKSLKVDCVRLEVRPDNLSAKHIYEKYGFEARGYTHDTQGEWLIMVKNLHGNL